MYRLCEIGGDILSSFLWRSAILRFKWSNAQNVKQITITKHEHSSNIRNIFL